MIDISLISREFSRIFPWIIKNRPGVQSSGSFDISKPTVKFSLPGLLSAFLVLSTVGFSQTYTTNFALTENPISEGGRWVNGGTVGLDWTNVSTTSGLAIGHEGGIVDYTDATALLTGSWGPDQSAMATIHTVNQNDACYEEVELRLRSSLSAHSCTGYEISEKCSTTAGAYLIIVRWNGAVGDFTILKELNGATYGIRNGDSVRATIIGNVVTAYINGVQMAQATDATFKTGNPGMGFNLHGCTATNGDYGFTSFTAAASTPTGIGAGESETPPSFFLGQNYPNPFNPSTTVRYGLPQRSAVAFTVFNTLGQLVSAPVKETQEAGYHELRFNGAQLPSGVYFYRIVAGSFDQTKKFLLLR